VFEAQNKSKRETAKSQSATTARSAEPALTNTGERISFQLFTQTPAADASNEREADAAASAVVQDQSDGADAAGGDAFPSSPPGAPPSPPSVPIAPFGVIVEDGSPLSSGQMHRTQFIEVISAEIERSTDEELAATGHTSRDCPYLSHWLRFYRERSAAHIERAIQHYARPERTDLISLREAVVARVRGAVQVWIRSGGREVQTPDGVAWLGQNDRVQQTPANGGAIQGKAVDGENASASAPRDPVAVRAQLKNGQPLSGGVRSRMERGFGQSLSGVRLHTDSVAARLTHSFSAKAFTIGNEIAFGAGQYRPESIVGDALLAHELAHTIQQGAGARSATGPQPISAVGSPLERQADTAAEHVVRSLWSAGGAEDNAAISKPITGASTGLRLQRCSDDSPKPAPAPPSPQDLMREALRRVLQDHTIVPAEWQHLNERARTLGIQEITLKDLAEEESVGGLRSNLARAVALLATRTGTAFETVRAAYTGSYTPGDNVMTPPLLPELLRAALADSSLDFGELDALRTLALYGQLPHYGDLRQEFAADKVAPAAVDGLMRIIDIGGMAWNSLAADPIALPLRLNANPQGQLESASDLRVALLRALTGDGAWSVTEFPIIRSLLQPLGRVGARQLLALAGFETLVADILAMQFTATTFEYGQRMPQEILFRRDGRNFALVTPIFPEVPASSGGSGVNLHYVGGATPLSDYTFRSGVTAPADRQMVEIRGRRIEMIRPNREEDGGMRGVAIIKANEGLGPAPPHHIALIQRIVLDPGQRQDAAADAGRDGTVTLYWASANGGPEKAQQIMIHELGHLVSFRAATASPDFWTHWRQAARDDQAAVSVYGTTNELEDFAEAYAMFIVNASGARKQFPHRAAILSPLVSPPAPVQTPPPSPKP
jgi:hypothetical protein